MQRILLADDDRALTDLLAEYLRREGFAVDVAHDGEEALARLSHASQRPDLLILDVMMPGRDGLETLRELRLQHRLPVIMLSARGEPVDRVIGLELGADDYLSKPCLPRELLARVRAQLRRHAPAMAGTLEVGVLRLLPGERRAYAGEVELALTGAGRTAVTDAYQEHNKREQAWVASLTPEERAVLIGLLEKLTTGPAAAAAQRLT